MIREHQITLPIPMQDWDMREMTSASLDRIGLGGTKCARLKVGVTGVGLAKGYQEDEQYNM